MRALAQQAPTPSHARPCTPLALQVFVWDPNEHRAAPRATLTHKNCKAVVRQTSVSLDGGTILASCEDGSLWRWDRQEEGEEAGSGGATTGPEAE